MPATTKIVSALAMSLALVGAGTSLAQSTNAPSGHTAYVTIVSIQETAGTTELTGEVACDVPIHERLVRKTLGKRMCDTSDYAYAYPEDKGAPWRGQIEDVDTSMYVDNDGSMWQVAEVSYHTFVSAPEGGPELVNAMASEILPKRADAKTMSYALPVNEELTNQSEGDLVVDVGPSPDEANDRTPVADTTLPDA